jgi:hypothetical protein
MSHPANGLNETMAKLPSHPATRAEGMPQVCPEDADGLYDLRGGGGGGGASAGCWTSVLSVPVSDTGGHIEASVGLTHNGNIGSMRNTQAA